MINLLKSVNVKHNGNKIIEKNIEDMNMKRIFGLYDLKKAADNRKAVVSLKSWCQKPDQQQLLSTCKARPFGIY